MLRLGRIMTEGPRRVNLTLVCRRQTAAMELDHDSWIRGCDSSPGGPGVLDRDTVVTQQPKKQRETVRVGG